MYQPWEAYEADTTIDVKKHHNPVTWNDKIAYGIVQALKYPTQLYFRVNMIIFVTSFAETKIIVVMHLQIAMILVVVDPRSIMYSVSIRTYTRHMYT